MNVLRENKESLMAVLEAFVYDPLINWRLMQADVDGRRDRASYMSVLEETSLMATCSRTRSRVTNGPVTSRSYT